VSIDQHIPPVAVAGSQGTTIEQSRAVAEVQAAVIVAQHMPRNLPLVFQGMREACRQTELAERAFYRFPRGGTAVTGPSIHLARELARLFGNISYGITELARDDQAGRSEMLAFAWDLQANTRVANSFIAPHYRDTKDGQIKLVDLRDIYESNTNQGARRLREAIWAVLPGYYVSEATDICRLTITEGGGKSLPQRVSDAVTAYEGIGVPVERLELRVGRGADRWTAYDVAQLGVTFRSIQRGELLADDEFPERRVTADDIIPAQRKAPEQPPEQPPAPQWGDEQRAEFLVDLDRAAGDRDLEALQELADTARAAGQMDLAKSAEIDLAAATEPEAQP
jgi:hypothetical protein